MRTNSLIHGCAQPQRVVAISTVTDHLPTTIFLHPVQLWSVKLALARILPVFTSRSAWDEVLVHAVSTHCKSAMNAMAVCPL